jgi:hypothetical protein
VTEHHQPQGQRSGEGTGGLWNLIHEDERRRKSVADMVGFDEAHGDELRSSDRRPAWTNRD